MNKTHLNCQVRLIFFLSQHSTKNSFQKQLMYPVVYDNKNLIENRFIISIKSQSTFLHSLWEQEYRDDGRWWIIL